MYHNENRKTKTLLDNVDGTILFQPISESLFKPSLFSNFNMFQFHKHRKLSRDIEFPAQLTCSAWNTVSINSKCLKLQSFHFQNHRGRKFYQQSRTNSVCLINFTYFSTTIKSYRGLLCSGWRKRVRG